MMSGRKRPMGMQAVPQWGLDVWMEIPDDDDPVFEAVMKKAEEKKPPKAPPREPCPMIVPYGTRCKTCGKVHSGERGRS